MLLKINGVNVASPRKLEVSIIDIDGETNRNARGDLIRDRIATKRKIICEWPPLSTPQVSTILQAVKDTFFRIEYLDPMEGTTIIKTFYVGDRTAPVLFVKNGVTTWAGLSMNFIER
jgi:hypothetical protein